MKKRVWPSSRDTRCLCPTSTGWLHSKRSLSGCGVFPLPRSDPPDSLPSPLSSPSGTVKKLTGTLKLIHEKYGKEGSEAKDEVVRRMEAAIADNADIGNHTNKIQDDITPLRALWLLQRMIPEV